MRNVKLAARFFKLRGFFSFLFGRQNSLIENSRTSSGVDFNQHYIAQKDVSGRFQPFFYRVFSCSAVLFRFFPFFGVRVRVQSYAPVTGTNSRKIGYRNRV